MGFPPVHGVSAGACTAPSLSFPAPQWVGNSPHGGQHGLDLRPQTPDGELDSGTGVHCDCQQARVSVTPCRALWAWACPPAVGRSPIPERAADGPVSPIPSSSWSSPQAGADAASMSHPCAPDVSCPPSRPAWVRRQTESRPLQAAPSAGLKVAVHGQSADMVVFFCILKVHNSFLISHAHFCYSNKEYTLNALSHAERLHMSACVYVNPGRVPPGV